MIKKSINSDYLLCLGASHNSQYTWLKLVIKSSLAKRLSGLILTFKTSRIRFQTAPVVGTGWLFPVFGVWKASCWVERMLKYWLLNYLKSRRFLTFSVGLRDELLSHLHSFFISWDLQMGRSFAVLVLNTELYCFFIFTFEIAHVNSHGWIALCFGWHVRLSSNYHN